MLNCLMASFRHWRLQRRYWIRQIIKEQMCNCWRGLWLRLKHKLWSIVVLLQKAVHHHQTLTRRGHQRLVIWWNSLGMFFSRYLSLNLSNFGVSLFSTLSLYPPGMFCLILIDLVQVVRGGGGENIWGLYARWHKLKGDLTMCSEALLKHVRFYQVSLIDVVYTYAVLK